MSDKKKKTEEEEEEEEEDSEPVVILKGRKGSIKIVSDADQNVAPLQPSLVQVPGAIVEHQKIVQQQQLGYQQISDHKDLSQPIQIDVNSFGGQAKGSPPAGSPGKQPVSPKAKAPLSPKQPQQSPKGANKQQQLPVQVQQQQQAISPQQQSRAPQPQAQASPQATPLKQIQVQQQPQQQQQQFSPKPAGQQQQQQQAPQQPAVQKQTQSQVQQMKQQVHTQSSGVSPVSASPIPTRTPVQQWSPQASPAEGGEHPVLRQVPLKPAGPLVLPEQLLLHGPRPEEPQAPPPPVEILDDFAWRRNEEGDAAVSAVPKPERQRSRLGNVWPPPADDLNKDLGPATAVKLQDPQSWVQQESVSFTHAAVAAPWARKDVGRLGGQWPPPEDQIVKEQVGFERNLRPQWPPPSEEVAPSSVVYQKMALQQVHSQVAKQKTYFGSGGKIKPDEDQYAYEQVNDQVPVGPVSPAVPQKPGMRNVPQAGQQVVQQQQFPSQQQQQQQQFQAQQRQQQFQKAQPVQQQQQQQMMQSSQRQVQFQPQGAPQQQQRFATQQQQHTPQPPPPVQPKFSASGGPRAAHPQQIQAQAPMQAQPGQPRFGAPGGQFQQAPQQQQAVFQNGLQQIQQQQRFQQSSARPTFVR